MRAYKNGEKHISKALICINVVINFHLIQVGGILLFIYIDMTWISWGFSLPFAIPFWNGGGVLMLVYEVSIGDLIDIGFTSKDCLVYVRL